jgi:phage terminase large subunit-like protein
MWFEGLNLGLAGFADHHGRQEIEAELLDVSGALWTRCTIEAARPHNAPSLIRVVVTIDPAATSTADETEIVVAGKDGQEQGLVLADASGRYQPTEWARTAIAAYRVRHADRVVAEVNHGGEMVEAALRVIDPNVAFAAVRASRDKVTRAESGGRALRARSGSPPRRLPAAQRSDVQLCAL